MRNLEMRLNWGDEETAVGTLGERERRIYFEYAPAFLDAALPISPFKLPVRPGVFEHGERDFAQMFGVFNDSLPDAEPNAWPMRTGPPLATKGRAVLSSVVAEIAGRAVALQVGRR
jgi:hypothetical protein